MQGRSCFFIGHREAPEDIAANLASEIRRHITELGVTEFVVGHYGRFDSMAGQAVIAAKREFPYIRLLLLIPYHPAEAPVDLPEGYDGTYYPPGMESVPRRFAIVRANRYMVDHTDYQIAYAWHPASNARELVEYAETRQKRRLMQVTRIRHYRIDNH